MQRIAARQSTATAVSPLSAVEAVFAGASWRRASSRKGPSSWWPLPIWPIVWKTFRNFFGSISRLVSLGWTIFVACAVKVESHDGNFRGHH